MDYNGELLIDRFLDHGMITEEQAEYAFEWRQDFDKARLRRLGSHSANLNRVDCKSAGYDHQMGSNEAYERWQNLTRLIKNKRAQQDLIDICCFDHCPNHYQLHQRPKLHALFGVLVRNAKDLY